MTADEMLPATLGGTRCPACAGPVEPAADAGDFALFACAGCGTWCSDAQLRGARTSFSPDAYFANSALDVPRWDDLLARIGTRPPAVLDVGCGTGRFLQHAARRLPGARLAGIELDAARAGQAAAANPGAHIAQGDALAVARALDGGFGLITLWDVLEHVPDPAGLLRALAARLAPGGCLFVQTIHEASLLPGLGRLAYTLTGGRVRGPLRRTHEPHHVTFFTRPGLQAMAGSAGLAIAALWFDRLAFGRMDGPLPARLAADLIQRLEATWGNGLFVNVLLEARGPGAPGPGGDPPAGRPRP